MNILHIIDTLNGGGAESQLLMTCQGLKKLGATSRVLSLHNERGMEGSFKELGIGTTFAADHRYRGYRPWNASQKRAHSRIQDLLSEYKPDIVHCHLGASYVVGSSIATRHGIPYVVTIHGISGWLPPKTQGVSLRSIVNSLLHRSISKSIRGADWVLGVSQPTLDYTFDHIGRLERASVLYNSISDQFSKPIQSTARQNDVVCVGRLVADKNLPVAVQSISLVVKTHPSLRVIFVGSGPQEELLRKHIEREGLSSNIELRGWKDLDAIIDILDQSWVLLAPSLREGFGIAVAEGLSRGLSGILSDIDTFRTVFSECEGVYFCMPNDAQAIANAIMECLSKQNIYDRSDLVAKFSIEQHASRLLETYTRVLSSKSR